MRSPIKPIVALFLLTLCSRTYAQYPDVDPRTLPAQISAQELVVQTQQGIHDWHAWLKLAVLLQDAGSYRESEDAYRRTIALLRAPDPLIVADIFDHMATMYIASGQLSNAEPLERHALAIRENQHDNLGTGVSRMHLAMLLLKQNAATAAETEALRAVALLVPEYAHSAATSSATPEEKMTALIDLAVVQCASGDNHTALPELRFALQLAHQNYSDDSLPVGQLEYLIGYAYWRDGNFKQAADLMSQGVHKLSAAIGWGQPSYLGTLRQYRAFLLETKQRTEAQRISAEIDRLDHSPRSFTLASGQVAGSQGSLK